MLLQAEVVVPVVVVGPKGGKWEYWIVVVLHCSRPFESHDEICLLESVRDGILALETLYEAFQVGCSALCLVFVQTDLND